MPWPVSFFFAIGLIPSVKIGCSVPRPSVRLIETTGTGYLILDGHRRRGGPQIECRSDVQFRQLASILENALYRIAQEALTNACKHSKSQRVLVTMTQEGQEVRLEVQDWGVGFDPESVETGHFGLEGIRQRVRLLGGRLSIESMLGSGALVQVVVPILERQAER